MTAKLTAFGAALGALLIFVITWLSLPRTPTPDPSVPAAHQEEGYAGSGACQACHPSEYASWGRTFHRSMTRRTHELKWNGAASPKLPVTLSLFDREFVLEKQNDSVVVLGPDLHQLGRGVAQIARVETWDRGTRLHKAKQAFAKATQVERRLVMVTGSHHYLAFWVEGGAEAELRQLPFVYLLAEGRWVQRRQAFLQPPDALPHIARWNSNCVQCHSVAGRPRQSEGRDDITGQFWERYETDAVELGIACESCHGPGLQHAQHYQNPFVRLSASQNSDENKPAHAIFNPERAAHLGESNACGQCHSYFVPLDPEQWWESGFSRSYQAGNKLSETRTVLRSSPKSAHEQAAFSQFSAHRDSLFWRDGSMIVGGREYNGLIESPCFQGEGEMKMACTSCHSMHGGQADGQLKADYNNPEGSDRMCTQCHKQIGVQHSQHTSTSSGARCVSCHMPKTSYALLSGIRSHRISSPQARQSHPPNACVLCHLDRDEAWISSYLSNWEEPPAAPPSAQTELPWAVILTLSGNAAVRAIFAHAWGASFEAPRSTAALAAQILPYLAEDDYEAIRLIAERSLRKRAGADTTATNTPLDPKLLEKLLRQQDQTPIVISE